MALFLLILIGSLLGWIGSIITRTEDKRGILRLAGAGAFGALLAGILFNNSTLLGGLNVDALLASFVGAALFVLVAHFLVQRTQQG